MLTTLLRNIQPHSQQKIGLRLQVIVLMTMAETERRVSNMNQQIQEQHTPLTRQTINESFVVHTLTHPPWWRWEISHLTVMFKGNSIIYGGQYVEYLSVFFFLLPFLKFFLFLFELVTKNRNPDFYLSKFFSLIFSDNQ